MIFINILSHYRISLGDAGTAGTCSGSLGEECRRLPNNERDENVWGSLMARARSFSPCYQLSADPLLRLLLGVMQEAASNNKDAST